MLTELGPGVGRDNSYIIGYSVAIEDGPCFYLPVRHEDGGNLDANQVERYMRDNATLFEGVLVNHHLQYDLRWLSHYEILFPKIHLYRDTEIAEALLDDLAIQYNLEMCCERHGLPGKDETLLKEAAACYGVDPKSGMWVMHSKFVGPYAEQDTRAVLKLNRRQERRIDQEDMWEVYNLESRCIPVLADMSNRGVRIDMAQLQKVDEWAQDNIEFWVHRFNEEFDADLHHTELDLKSKIGPILERNGIFVPRTEKTGEFSITKDYITTLEGTSANTLVNAKAFNKLRGTFVKSIQRHVVDGRLHPTFNQSRRESEGGSIKGAVSGRLSSSNPNIQQQPSRDDLKLGIPQMWRTIYIPDEGGLWACNDYSQQEPRMMVHYAEAFRLRGSKDAGDNYRNDPDTDFHTMMAKVTGLERKFAKTVFLGICYGMGLEKMATDLNVSMGEAERIKEQFLRLAPFVGALASKCTRKAHRDGVIPTIKGRRLHFPKKSSGFGHDFTHKALNRLIQGSCADQTKIAMVEAHNAGFKLQIQVHDELDLTVEHKQEAEQLAEVMSSCLPLKVPAKVDVEIGPNWGEVA